MHREPYRFFTNLSGLSQASFGMLSLVGGRFRSLSRWNREQRTESHALSRGPMTLIVLATTGLLACAFYIYVLCRWMQDANDKSRRTSPPAIPGQSGATQQNNRIYIMGSRKYARRCGRDVSSRRR